jgi:hypothetical protein
MSFVPDQHQQLRELQQDLRRTRTVTPDLMTDVIVRACPRVRAYQPAANARLMRLIEAGAFVDAMLALLELELPQWKLRRLICEDGEWHCALSKRLALPAELDDMAEGRHENFPLAILTAFVEARRHGLAPAEDRPKSVPQVGATRGYAICCDNFA